MSGDRTDPPIVDDEPPIVDDGPLGTDDPTWRDEQPGTEAPRRHDDDDAERTIDADPAWLAQLTGGAAPDVAGAGDAERTIDVDADLLEHVRAAARAARDGLAAPPTPEATDAEPEPAAPATEPSPATGVDPWLPPPPGGVTSSLLLAAEAGTLPPPTVAPPATVAAAPPVEFATPVEFAPPVEFATPVEAAAVAATDPVVSDAAPTASATATGGGRWQPPARLRPAEVRPTAPLLADPAPKRRHLDWRWAALGIVLAAAVGFLIAIAVSGGDDAPDPAPGSTTVPGASTTVSTP